MSIEWSSGYVTDLGYIHGFYRELTPSILQFSALLKGVESCILPNEKINYCELGCGQGFSANIIAAANPHIEVYATDFNPEQISGAQRLANAAGTPNVHFFDNSFAEFHARSDLPQFDIITLHGIYSWIAKEHRETIVRFIDTRLKPGGLVYVSYNCLPGWAGAAPLRQLMRLQAMESTGTIATKIEASFGLIEKLESSGARYFKAIPDAKTRFSKIKGMSRNYLAHEYMNSDWTLFYHSDVAAEMSEARLSYIASAHPHDHVDQFNLTSDQQNILQEVANPTTREVLRDYIVNQQFRRDIFARGAVALSTSESREKWLNSYFVLTTPVKDISMKMRTSLGEVTLQEEAYKPLIEAFAALPSAACLREIVKVEAIANLGWNRLQQAITILVGAGHLHPCTGPASDEERRRSNARAFNDAVIDRSRYSADLRYLASPVTGGAVVVDRFEQLFLLSLRNNEKDQVSFAWKLLKNQNQKISKDGIILKTDEENFKEIESRFSLFEERKDMLMKVGVL